MAQRPNYQITIPQRSPWKHFDPEYIPSSTPPSDAIMDSDKNIAGQSSSPSTSQENTAAMAAATRVAPTTGDTSSSPASTRAVTVSPPFSSPPPPPPPVPTPQKQQAQQQKQKQHASSSSLSPQQRDVQQHAQHSPGQQHVRFASPKNAPTTTTTSSSSSPAASTGPVPHPPPSLSPGSIRTNNIDEQQQQNQSPQRQEENNDDNNNNNNVAATTDATPKKQQPPTVAKFHPASNPRHMIPWNQRLPGDRSLLSSFAQTCGFCLAPKFWKRIENALRNTIVGWLPSVLILLNDDFRALFKHPFNLPFALILIFGYKFGDYTMKLASLVKCLSTAIALAACITWGDFSDRSDPAVWIGFWFAYFVVIVIISVFTQGSDAARQVPFFFSAFLLNRWFFPDSFASYQYYLDYTRDLFIGVCFAVGPSFLPFPSFAARRAEELLQPMGNTISILVQGCCASAWTANVVEQRLDLVRLQQMRGHLRDAEAHIFQQLQTAWWEPFSAITLKKIQVRFELLSRISVQMSSFVRLVDQIANDEMANVNTEESTFVKFGDLLKDDIQLILDSFDSTILRLTDCTDYITDDEMESFRAHVQHFMLALLHARTTVYYGENVHTYKLQSVDLYSAHFFFFLEELFDIVSKFREPKEEELRYRVSEMLDAAWGIPVAVWGTLTNLHLLFSDPVLVVALQEGIKLATTMTAAAFLSYPLGVNTVTPSIIALMHFAGSTFLFSSQHIQGIIYGGIFSFIVLELAQGNYASQIILFELLIFCAWFVMTSINWISAAIATLLNIATMIIPGQTESELVERMTNSITAMAIHLMVTSFLLWPNNPISKLRSKIDESVSLFRDGICTLLTQIRPSHMDDSCTRGLFSAMQRQLKGSVVAQRMLLTAAASEPTLVGSNFPLPLFHRVIAAEERMTDIYFNMCVAFGRLQAPANDEDANKKQMHWVIVRTVSGPLKKLAELVSGLTDLILLLMHEGTATVPTSELVHLSNEITKLAEVVCDARNNKINKIRERKYKRVSAIRAKAAAAAAAAHAGDVMLELSDEEQQEREAEAERKRQQMLLEEGNSDEDLVSSSDEGDGGGARGGGGGGGSPSDNEETDDGGHSQSDFGERRMSSGTPRVKVKVDPRLGVDMDTISTHALSTFIVATVGIGRIMGELLEALLDISNVEEISRMSE